MNSTAPASRPTTAQVAGRMCLEVGLSIVAYQTVVYQKEEYRHCAGPVKAKPEAGTCRNRDCGKEDEVIALARPSRVGTDRAGEETGRASVF